MNNETIIERIFRLWRAGCADDILDCFAEDARWHFSAATKPPAIGREAIAQFLARYAAVSAENRLRLTRQLRQGDLLFFEAVEDFTTPDGRDVALPYAGVLSLRAGRIADWRDYFDRKLIDSQIEGSGSLPDYAREILTAPAAATAPVAGGLVGDMILQAIDRFADRPAFVEDDRTTSYRLLGRRIAHALKAFDELGLRPGDVIAQISGNSSDMYAVMAAAYIGGYTSLTLHPMGGRDDQEYILRDSGARILVADGSYGARAAGFRVEHLRLLGHGPQEAIEDFWAFGDETAPLPNHAGGASDDIVRLAYTGGTTGRPKGVMLSNRALVANSMMALAALPWPEDIRFLCPAPMSHGAGSIVIPTLVRGGQVIVQRGFDTDQFLAALERHKATLTWLVPTMIGNILDSAAIATTDHSSLKALIWSGAPMSPTRVAQAIERFGPILVQCYGQTEAPNTILFLAGEEHAAHPAAAGRPFPGIELALLDDQGRPVAPGQPGEICVRGPLVMSGYKGLPQASEEAFAHGWLHTGDVGRVDASGMWSIVDRKKDMIISGGFNVFPKEIEDVIASQPGVAGVCVFGIPHEKWGEAVAAVVVPSREAAPDVNQLALAVRDAKGPVQTPKLIELVDAIPQTGLGKPDKKALREAYRSGR